MEKQCRNCVLWCAYRLEQKQATQMNWKFHLYEEDAPDEGGYYEAAVGAHYLWVVRREGGGWQLTVADEAAESLASRVEAAESLASRVIEEHVPLSAAQREAVMLYISLLSRWLGEAVSQV